ncbi:M48 family metalloprotease [Sphingomonas flavalba]|uniref:M48 family metalloprotease n=1 Tax=Sphingomonas flavalba TaxID=2559804 RepID=UPI0039E05954
MFARMLLALVSLCLAAPVAAAGVDASGLAALQQLDSRLAQVGNRLAVAAAGLCADARPLPGFAVHALKQYQPAARAAAAEQFGLGEQPAVLAVVPGSAAEAAGLRAGDAILAVAGAAVAPVPAEGRADYAGVAAVEQRIEQALAQPPLRLSVARDGGVAAVAFTTDSGCPTRFQVLATDGLKASADGTYVQVSAALIQFAASDDELAIVVAHELAHNILRHRETLDAQKVSRGMLAAFGKNRSRIRATERQADRLAIWLAARAGYAIAAAPAFWDRFERRTGWGILSDGTHDGRRERVAAAEAEIAAVEARRAAGLPLDPPPALRPAQ